MTDTLCYTDIQLFNIELGRLKVLLHNLKDKSLSFFKRYVQVDIVYYYDGLKSTLL